MQRKMLAGFQRAVRRVISRGDRRDQINLGKLDRHAVLKTLAPACWHICCRRGPGPARPHCAPELREADALRAKMVPQSERHPRARHVSFAYHHSIAPPLQCSANDN